MYVEILKSYFVYCIYLSALLENNIQTGLMKVQS